MRQATMLCSLVDGWDGMNAHQRKRLLGSVSEGIVIQDGAVSEMTPKEGWRPFLRGALPSPRVLTGLTERKTGLYVPDVETARLVQDERGWLRLAS